MENTPRADIASPAMRTTSAAARRAISIPLANNSTVRLATKTHPPLETLTPLRYCGGGFRAKFFHFKVPPRAGLSFHQVVGFPPAPPNRRRNLGSARRPGLSHVPQRLNHAPAGFDH